ncbi:hypothetical protein [Candidatus Ichthyocystis hellenicum]|uniref:hypothetical protein n=1 Tax=Candidatus Ichthyocystis hellenicum TaxID=1561003 RepID=UPI001111F826|nr:hypothetical protein [Candidatus Ichthyocystis hellenicum]
MIQKRKESPTTSTWSNSLNIFSHPTKNVPHVEKDNNHFQDNVVNHEPPYKYIGKMTYDNTQYVFLEYNDQTIVAKKGKVLPGNYRYDYFDKNKIIFTDMGNQSKHEMIVGAEP